MGVQETCLGVHSVRKQDSGSDVAGPEERLKGRLHPNRGDLGGSVRVWGWMNKAGLWCHAGTLMCRYLCSVDAAGVKTDTSVVRVPCACACTCVCAYMLV